MDQLTAEAGQSPLETLPQEILNRIVRALFGENCSVAPRYGDANDYIDRGTLESKHLLYYGSRCSESTVAIRSALNLCASSRNLRNRTCASVFNTVVLRSTPSSTSSIKDLQLSPLWREVHSLVFACTYHTRAHFDDHLWKGHGEGIDSDGFSYQRCPECLCPDDVSKLEQILAHLPDNLTSLTLDLPTTWIQAPNAHRVPFWDNVQSCWTTADGVADLEENDIYCHMWTRVLSCITKHDFSKKTELELRLLGVPFHKATAFSELTFYQLLNSTTNFTLGLSTWAGDYSDAFCEIGYVDYDFDKTFWDHLKSATHCSFLANISRAIGAFYRERYYPMCLLPTHLPKLTHLALSAIAINEELANFITCERPNNKLKVLILHDCYVQVESHDFTTWAAFFIRLSEAKRKLQYLNITYSTHLVELIAASMLGDGEAEDYEQYNPHHSKFMRYQRCDTLSWTRVQPLPPRNYQPAFAYRNVRRICGILLNFDKQITRQAYEEGSDFRRWLELRDLMESNNV